MIQMKKPPYCSPSPEPDSNSKKKLDKGRVYINKGDEKEEIEAQYFEGIDENVWNHQIGGYQVLHKWLKDRKGRKLSHEDLIHYQRIVVALKETIRIMAEIDKAIPNWPIE